MSMSLPQPSTPPYQPASELPFETTPVRQDPYATRKGLVAAKVHALTGLALHPTAVGPNEFWTETLETTESYKAAQLSEADLATLQRQYRKLAELRKKPKISESLSYVPTTIILNLLSLAHATAYPLPDDQVVGWFLNPTQLLFGDPFAKSLKPDIVAYLVTRKTAEDYLQYLQSRTTISDLDHLRPAWAQLISAAELKVSASGQSQLLHYLEAICSYRPDLVSVVAISSKLYGYQFYSLNAAHCLKYSDVLEWKDKNTPSLQRFITAVYQTQKSRYGKMNYLQGSLQAWSLKRSSRRWDMLPFHSGHYPGRGTWVACAIETTETTETTEATSPGAKVYIVKSYWADAGSRWNEGDLYQDAHGNCEIPGLAHIEDYWRTGKVVSGSRKPGGPIMTREQVCVILSSAGRPLSECKDVNEILGTMFDLLETLRVMCHRGVVHRDISWGNAMLNPTHTNSVASPVVSCLDEQQPLYISEILKQEVPGSLSLLTDLDCSAKLQDLREDAKTSCHLRTGTPMFIAMEISSKSVGWTPFPFTREGHAYFQRILSSNPPCSRLRWLGQKAQEQLHHISEQQLALARASVNFTNSMQDLDDIPCTSGPEQKPVLVHTPRHDAESVFWLLWFLLARANPRGEAPVAKDSAEKEDYDTFCSIMLNHTVGASVDTRVPLAQMSIEQYRHTLHPHFSHLGDMMYYMGNYFLIDPKTWSNRKDPLDDAYYFMEFLLLGEMLRNEGPRKLPLDITQPRPAMVPMTPVRRLLVPIESSASHSYSGSLTQDTVVSCSVSSLGSLALKRKSDTGAQGCPSPRRLQASEPEQNPGFPTPDRAETNEDGCAAKGENKGKFLDEQANYVASQETLEIHQELEEEALKKWFQSNTSLVQVFNAATDIQVSMLRRQQWFTVFME